MKLVYYLLIFIFFSCSYVDRIGDKEIKVIGNIYLLKIDEAFDGFTLTKKIDENISTYIIDDKIIKTLFNENNIFVISVFSADTNYYHIPYSDTIQHLKVNEINKETFVKLINKQADLAEVITPK